jgi:hypothetical protein
MILVGGTGRSGTSIVKELIAAHPDAASLPFEYRFIIDPDGLVDFYAGYTAVWSPYLADRKVKRLERLLHCLSEEPFSHRLLGTLIQWLDPDGRALSPRAYHGWELTRHLPNFQQHVEDLMSQLVEFSFPACWVGTDGYQRSPTVYYAPPRSKPELARVLGDFVRGVIEDLLSHTGKAFFVEDNTWNILLARELLDFLPDARIVHVYRDPRDVVASFSQQRWSPTDKEQGARWYKAMMNHWFDVRSTLDLDSYHELSLESLVASPESALRRLCEFADIPFDEAMLALDLSHSHSGRWKTDCSEQEKVEIHRILEDIIRQLGYDFEGARY